MGRPPSNGGPSFRFNPTEVAEMEAILQAHKTQVPSREVLVALADKFSSSSDRAGKITVQMKQVWNWFQNRRYAIRAKASRNPVKLSSSPAPSNLPQVPQFMSMSVNPSQATIRNLPQVLLPVSSASVPNAGQSTSDNLLMEYEARSARDGAWYDVATFISHRSVETTDPEVLVRFAGLGPEEDEWVNIRKHVRQRSLPCEASECVAVCQADLILCFQEGKDQALYYDAHVLDAQRRRHDVRGCRCRFLVRYDHDQSEEIVPLKKVCRRPETDYRMQQLAESGNINGNKVNLEPHSGNTVTPSSSEKLVKAETKEQPKVASTQSVLPPITNTNASVTTVAVANSVSAAYPACFVAPAAQPTASVVTTTIPISQSTVSGATLPPVSTSKPAVFSGDLGATVTTAATSTVVGSITSGTTVSAAGTTNPDAQAIVSEASLFTESAKSLAVHSIDSGTPYPTSAQPTSGATPFTVRATNEAVAVCDSQATAPTNEVVQVSASEVPAITISESQAIASGNETDPVSGSLATVSSTEAVPVSGSLATVSSTEAVLVSDSQAAASMNESVAVDDSQAPASMSEVIPVSDSLAAESVNEEVPVSDSQDVSMNEATPVSDSQAAASVNEVIPLSGSQAGLIPVGDSQTDVSKKEAILLGDSQADASMNEAVVPVSDAQADVSVSEAITVSNDQADVPMNEADVSMNEGVSDSQADASMSEAIPVGDSHTDVSKKEVIPVGDSQADVSMSAAIPVTDAQADASRNEAVVPVSDAQADVSVSEAIPVSNDQADVSMNEAVSDSQADASMNEAVPASDSHATASIHKVVPIAKNGSVTQEATLCAATATTPAVQLTEPPVTAALVIDSLYSEASASPKTQTHNASESIDSEASVFVVAAEATPAVQPINSGPIVSMVTAITSGSPTTQDANSSLSGTAVTTSGALSAAGATDSVVTTATITPVSSPANEAGASDSVLPATTVDSDQVQEITDSMATEED